MTQRSEDLLTVLDAGSSKIRVLVAELHEGALRYRAHSVINAEGMRKGLISDLGPASRAFNLAFTEAEQMAQAVIANCVVGLGGSHVRGVNSQGGISLGSRLREITREDVRAAVERARSVSLPADREVLHLLPQQFILDEQPGIHDPIGMIGNRLEVNLHIATCSASAAQSVITCANKAGLEVSDTIFEGIAAAEATVSADERELGACLIDIGAASTELVVFFEGAVAHTAVIPIGGDHFTNDLAVGLHVPVQEAEALKLEYGHCVVTSVPSSCELEMIAGGNQVVRTIKQRQLCEILEPRARELFQMLRENLRQGGVLGALGAGCILTGGGARLAGLLEVAESLLRVPARLGYPECPTNSFSRNFLPRLACCFTPIAPACCARPKIRACVPSCAPSSQEVYSQRNWYKRNGAKTR
jgi:cell division protein FtsA